MKKEAKAALIEAANMTPIINVIKASQEARDKYFSDLDADFRATSLSPVQLHKAALGRQATTWVGEFRFYIWFGPGWRIFVANGYGVSFEVSPEATVEEAMTAWADYRTKMGRSV